MAEQDAKEPTPAKAASSWLADLPDVINQLWTAFATPLLELALTVSLLDYILDIKAAEILNLTRSIFNDRSQTASIVDLYGLKSFLPAATLILLLGIARANSEILQIIGKFVPPQLNVDSVYTMAICADRLQLLAVWEAKPFIIDMKGVDSFIDAEMDTSQFDRRWKGLFSDSRKLRGRVQEYLSFEIIVKGILVEIILGPVLSLIFAKHGVNVFHLFWVILAGCLILLSTFVGRLRLERELARRKVEECYCFLQVIGDKVRNASQIASFLGARTIQPDGTDFPIEEDPRIVDRMIHRASGIAQMAFEHERSWSLSLGH